MIPSTSGSATSARPTVSPGPVTTCSAPAGTPASQRISQVISPVNTPCSLGFSTTVLPATSAAPIGPADSAIGKLNGLITAHTPYGRMTSRRRLGRVEPAHRQREPVVLGHLVAVVADEVGGLLDVAERLEPVLADLHRHERGELGAVLADLVGGALEDRDPLLPRRRGPRRRGGARRGDRVAHVGVGRGREPADDDVAVARGALLERACRRRRCGARRRR